MINNDYIIDMDGCDSGGHCDFLPIKGEPHMGFKNFKHISKAKDTLHNQKILSRFDLAPKPLTGLCKIPYNYDPELLRYWTPNTTVTDWGYITEKAEILDVDDDNIPYQEIQNLVDEIEKKTSLKFWDCHLNNIGIIIRNKKEKLVCIDTGKESFTRYSNVWGNADPGPRCDICRGYSCECQMVYKKTTSNIEENTYAR